VGGEPEIEVGLIWLLDAHALGPILIRAGSKPGNEALISKPDGRRS
jgi:hypothetical protein